MQAVNTNDVLYQVATAGLEQEAIAYPLLAISRQWQDAAFLMYVPVHLDFCASSLVLLMS